MIPSKKKVLIVDDEKKVRLLLSDSFSEHGFDVKTKGSGEEATAYLKEMKTDAVVLDLMMPGNDGIQTLKAIKKINRSIPVIMLSGHGTIEKAIEAVKIGAYDFLEKPVSSEKIVVTINNAINSSNLEKDKNSLINEVKERYRIVGISGKLKKVLKTVDKYSMSNSPVLITGESGTGKELIARAIHLKSERAAGHFIPLNCSAIPEDLLESELFGHEKGSFTGAVNFNKGLFRSADRGTLFLDEISEMSLKLQPKLLRAIETGEMRSVGSSKLENFNVRIISATNKDLINITEKGFFREDLFYRLSVLTINLPPLRDRIEDIPVLIEYFTEKFCTERGVQRLKYSTEAMKLLMDYNWPGNVRQLKNTIERIIVMSETQSIDYDIVEKSLVFFNNFIESKTEKTETSLKDAVKNREREKIITSLHIFNWDYKKVAEDLQISRATLFNKIRELNIFTKRERKKSKIV